MPVTNAGKKYNCELVLAEIDGDKEKIANLYAGIEDYTAQSNISDSKTELMQNEHFALLSNHISSDIFATNVKGKSVQFWFSQLKKEERTKVNEARRVLREMVRELQ